MAKQYESGHPKLLESLGKLIGAYGFKSPEYRAVNAIPFRKPKL